MTRDYEPDQRGMGGLFRSRELQQLAITVANDLVPVVAAVTPRDTGAAAASTRAEPDRGPRGIAGAKVVQGGPGADGAVPAQFGNRHQPAQHHLERALGGLS